MFFSALSKSFMLYDGEATGLFRRHRRLSATTCAIVAHPLGSTCSSTSDSQPGPHGSHCGVDPRCWLQFAARELAKDSGAQFCGRCQGFLQLCFCCSTIQGLMACALVIAVAVCPACSSIYVGLVAARTASCRRSRPSCRILERIRSRPGLRSPTRAPCGGCAPSACQRRLAPVVENATCACDYEFVGPSDPDPVLMISLGFQPPPVILMTASSSRFAVVGHVDRKSTGARQRRVPKRSPSREIRFLPILAGANSRARSSSGTAGADSSTKNRKMRPGVLHLAAC